MQNALSHYALDQCISRILLAAEKHGLPASLVAAVVMVESAGDSFAWNPEPHYRYLVDVSTGRPFRSLTRDERLSEIPPQDFPCYAGDRDAEWWGQQASWGLMQVMGAVARERGFDRKLHLPQLCEPATGLEFGCRHLVELERRFRAKFGWAGVAAAYNAGSPRVTADGSFENQVYVDKIDRWGGFDGIGA